MNAHSHDTPDRMRFWEIVILGLTGLAAFLAVGLAWLTQRNSEARSAEEMRFEMQRDGIRAFVDGYRDFTTAIYTIRNRLPVDVEEPDAVDRMSSNQMKELREVTIPIIAAQYSYNSNFRSSLPAWPKEIRTLLVDTAKYAREIALCYEAGSFRALDDKEAGEIKQQLNAQCRFLGNKNDAFQKASDGAYAAMVNELVESATRLGADPDKTPPLTEPSTSDNAT